MTTAPTPTPNLDHATAQTNAATITQDCAIAQGCATAERRLRWVYTATYRRRLRLPGAHRNPQAADRRACEELRHHTPIVLARHLPGIELVEWLDPHPTVIDSAWTLPGWDIDLYWNYHANWTIGDPTGLTIWPTPTSVEAVA